MKYILIIIFLLGLGAEICAQNNRKKTVNGWKSEALRFGPELDFNLLIFYSAGMSINFQKGVIHKFKKPKKFIYEIAPGVDFVFAPDLFANFKFRLSYRTGIPLSYGVQYNYLTDFDLQMRQSVEFLLGFCDYPLHFMESIFWRVYIGYDYAFKSEMHTELYTPIKVHLSIGINL